ncbi:MAG TPA: 16S rRNA (guanine(966)-N(2))-methyltransferase RsmD [Gammaproteobacteria bacterium]|nr:16S rRNA (guanine(966)-N(2))-methyltransferase RsmD [Gammaproteobacteria bacterium]
MSPAHNNHQNHIRIIAGRWRGRNLHFSSQPGLRPTPNRIRETLFNWLRPYLAEARCLDLFAGSGALGIEAISQGAASVVLVEKNPIAARHLQQICHKLDCNQLTVVNRPAQSWLYSCTDQFDGVFLDPPFTTAQLSTTVAKLESSTVLTKGAWIYIEQSVREKPVIIPVAWELLHQKSQGEVLFSLYKKS